MSSDILTGSESWDVDSFAGLHSAHHTVIMLISKGCSEG